MDVDAYIDYCNTSINKFGSYIEAADGLPGLYYDAEEVKGYYDNIEFFNGLKEILKEYKELKSNLTKEEESTTNVDSEENSLIISAKDALMKSKNIIETEFKEEIEKIFKEIHKNVNSGNTSVYLDYAISDRATKYLEELGYKVNIETWTRETTEYTTDISWEDNG